MAFNTKFTITNAITGALTRIERAHRFLEAGKLSKNGIREMQERDLVRARRFL